MNRWKWSNGETYYRSARIKDTDTDNNPDIYDSQKNAINQSLADNYDYDSINITNSIFSRNKNEESTRREDLDDKMADRPLIAQRGINPFMSSSYVNDVVTRDMYLKPICTTYEKTKKIESNQN